MYKRPRENPASRADVEAVIQTWSSLREAVRGLGLTISKNSFGEYRINYPGAGEETAYYTDDPEDAMGTAQLMAETLT